MMKHHKLSETKKLETLRAAVKLGDEQLDRGEAIAYTKDRLAQITAKAFDNAVSGKRIKSDVRP